MTKVSQEQQPQLDEMSYEPSLSQQPPTNPHRENDMNEESAREKFKKTSIASLSNHMVSSEDIQQSENALPPTDSSEQTRELSSEDKPDEISRGRPAGKRALDCEDSIFSASDTVVAREEMPDPTNGHIRKRSRDVKSGQHVKVNEREQDIQKDPLGEEPEDMVSSKRHETSAGTYDEPNAIDDPAHFKSGDIPSSLGDNVETTREETLEQEPGREERRSEVGERKPEDEDGKPVDEEIKPEDEEMKEGAYSPRRKRSRDQMDTVADREQKIAATDETRAQRRSEELDRADPSLLQGVPSSDKGSSHGAVSPSATDAPNKDISNMARSEAPKATFGTTNILRPLTESVKSRSAREASDDSHNLSAPAPSAFASSGFATFASSSTSPFGAARASSTSTASNTSTLAQAPTDLSYASQAGPLGQHSFGSVLKASSADNRKDNISVSASEVSRPEKMFGGPTFGGNFRGGFGGGSKLTSFAAPIGDAKLGSANGSVKPIGSSIIDEEDKDGSESDEEGDENGSRIDESNEAADKFQHQDVDTGEDGEITLFSSRAKLYAYKENNWREAGNGIFKLNVVTSEIPKDTKKSGRFIMRAHQTYRVLLNQPVFPQMQVGDRSGNEPTGKAFAFAVIVDGKPVPHMVRFGDVSESKTLYHEITRLQHDATLETRSRTLDPTGKD